MLRFNHSIRLTPQDIDRWIEITGFEPFEIRCLDDLDAYIERCKSFYWGTSRETQYLHRLMDREREIQLNKVPAVMQPTLIQSGADIPSGHAARR